MILFLFLTGDWNKLKSLNKIRFSGNGRLIELNILILNYKTAFIAHCFAPFWGGGGGGGGGGWVVVEKNA